MPTSDRPDPPAADGDATARTLQEALGTEFEVGALIGEGGFAQVRVAWDRRLKREVAIKALRPELRQAPDVVDRFRREAEAVAQLRHPHIVPIYGVGDAKGVTYFVMPRISGESLAHALRREERWSFAEVVRILREAAGALAEAHRNGIVHRDVKPENIMLDGPERRVVVMDFGIAKSLGETAAGAHLTSTGMQLGTPLYMSPEQAVGENDVGPLSDQYSLALVGYQLLTGRLPFEADSLRGLLVQQIAATLTPISERRPDVPAALARVIERALEREPARRYATMAEFGRALGDVAAEVAGEFRVGRRTPPMQERWASARQELLRFPRRLVALGVIGLIAFILAYPRAESAEIRRVAGQREEAIFAARAWLAARADLRGTRVRSDFYSGPRTHEFAYRALPRDSATVRLGGDLHAWYWDHSFASPAGKRAWWVYTDGSNRVFRYQAIVAHTEDVPPDLGDSVARAMEDSVVEALGWKPRELNLSNRSTDSQREGVFRTARWNAPQRSLVLGADTAHFDVQVGTRGGALYNFDERLTLPTEFVPWMRSSTSSALEGLLGVEMLGMMIVCLLIALVRSQRDSVQWRTSAVLGTVGMSVFVLTEMLPFLPRATVPFGAYESSALGMAVNYIVGGLPIPLMVFLVTTSCYALGESLTNESRPSLTAGLTDLTRGKRDVPELLPAAAVGYAVGLALLGASYLIAAVLHTATAIAFPPTPANGEAFELGLPILGVVNPLLASLGFASFSLALIAFGSRLTMAWVRWMIYLFIGISFANYRLLAFSQIPPRALIEALVFAVCAWVVDRFGYLAGVVCVFVITAVPVATDLVWSGGSPFVTAGVLGFVVIAAPGLLAILVARRQGRSPA